MSVLDDDVSNPSDNPHLVDVAGLSRRAVLGGGLAAATAAIVGASSLSSLVPTAGATGAPGPGAPGRHQPHGPGPLLGFTPVPPSVADEVVVPDGYTADVLIPWGTPLHPRGPEFRFDGTNSADDQAQQVGTSHDGMHFFPEPGRGRQASTRGVLAVNHEFADQETALPAGSQDMTPENVRKLQNAQGVSVVEVRERHGRWEVVASRRNRRITSNTPMAVSGPAAGHALLRTSADQAGTTVLGTANNCAAGSTPWGTYLTCEENFNAYFGTTQAFTPSSLEARYGFSADGFGPSWYLGDARFDLRVEPNEANRFGWVVEIDPTAPRSVPVKRTALGRLKHENAAFAEAADGRAVVYTGDDERNEYLYKYVSARPWRQMRREGVSPLDEGTLHVAVFADDATAGDGTGRGTWVPLTMDHPALAAEFGGDLGAMLVNARRAADLVGATKMDRPEWVAVSLTVPGRAAVTLTNNSTRGVSGPPVDEANPRPRNPFGHIVVWDEAAADHAATAFDWRILVLAGDPANEAAAGGPVSDDIDAFGAPDGLWFSPEGRLWIQTDGTQPIVCNNQMLCCDPATGEVRRFLVGPKGCEITGIASTPDGETLFVNVQHPGEGAALTPATPAAVSDWPDRRGRPRAATVVIRKVGGGVIGS